MKTNTIVIGIVVLLIIAGGVYLSMKKSIQPADQNVNPAVNSGTSAKVYDVEIVGMKFSPAELTIKAGDTVVWTNKDKGMPHGVLSDIGQSELAGSPFYEGKTYQHTFNTTGTFSYHCGIHPSMKGKIIVTE